MTLFAYFLRRSRTYGFLGVAGLFLFHYFTAFVYRGLIRNIEGAPAFVMRFIPKGIQAFVGMDRVPLDSTQGFLGLVYQHPFVIVVVSALGIICSVEFLAGQVERMTVTHILARPVSRSLLPLIAYTVCLFWLVLATGSSLAGTIVGFRRLGFILPPAPQMLELAATLFLLGAAVAGLAVFFASITSSRGDATGWSTSILLAMYVGNYLAQLWDAAKPWARFSLFNHYVPMRIFAEGATSSGALLIFAVIAAAGVIGAVLSYAIREFHL
ncbi:MAG: hypothetical protein N2Z21_02660 [Candidatus Sumerlaeaceae bacterium]|nr:hypothetical protein [Candidatus Sumerlaeaceae bacterium]